MHQMKCKCGLAKNHIDFNLGAFDLQVILMDLDMVVDL